MPSSKVVRLGHLTISSSLSEVRLQIDSSKVIKLGKSAIVSTRKDMRQLIPAGSDINLEAHLAITRCSSDVRSQIHSGKPIKLEHAEMMSSCRVATCWRPAGRDSSFSRLLNLKDRRQLWCCHSMPSSSMSLNDLNSSQLVIHNSSREVRYCMARDRDESLGQLIITKFFRKFRFEAHSFGRDAISFIDLKNIDFNLERGEEEEEGSEEAIVIVCCKGFQLTLSRYSCSSRYGNKGMKVRLGHSKINIKERRGNEGNDGWYRWCEWSWSGVDTTKSLLFHHPFSLRKYSIVSDFCDGKNVLDTIVMGRMFLILGKFATSSKDLQSRSLKYHLQH